MAKWKCEICGSEFENFHAQGFNHKIYCPLCFFKKKNQELKKQNNNFKTALDESQEVIIDYIKETEELKKQLEERKYYKFYKYENNPNGSDYCFCESPCDSNMSLICFFENGEFCGFMSETLVNNHDDIKEISLKEFAHEFIKPLINANFQNKKKLEPDYYVKGLEGSLKEYQQEMNKVESQQKEFVDWLENYIERLSPPNSCNNDSESLVLNIALQKYREIMEVPYDETN